MSKSFKCPSRRHLADRPIWLLLYPPDLGPSSWRPWCRACLRENARQSAIDMHGYYADALIGNIVTAIKSVLSKV